MKETESMTEKFKETNDRILAISRRLFSQNGIANVEMKDICKEVGCSRSTLYRHFASKEAILFVLTNASVIRIMEAAIIPPRMRFANGYEALSWQLQSQIAYMENNVNEITFMRDFDYFYTRFIPETEEGIKFEREMIQNRGRQELLKSLSAGVQDGSICPVENLELMVYTLVNSCIAMAQRILPRENIYRNEMKYGREMLEKQAELLLSALKAK